MLKEINGACSLHDAEVLKQLASSYNVSVELSPYQSTDSPNGNPDNDTVVKFTELKENVIDYRFFGTMYQLLNKNPEVLVEEKATETNPVQTGTVVEPQPVPIASGISLWGRFLSYLHPQEVT